MFSEPILLDCTLRDGGYYNNWDFSKELIDDYLKAMVAVSVDYVELGLRGFGETGFKGACAFTTDSFVGSLNIPHGLQLGVMVNASDLLSYPAGMEKALDRFFRPAADSPISLVRIACHIAEFEAALPASTWLKERGYVVGYNLMQIAGCAADEINRLGLLASGYPLDVLYFADSLGGMDPVQTSDIIRSLRQGWQGALGVHTHDNLGLAMSNTLQSLKDGVTWVDCTVTGMGRGPGNAKTEYLALEMAEIRRNSISLAPLMELIRHNFDPMQKKYGWGTNAYYYLAGKYSIHPTYIQEMMADPRYSDEDILTVIDHLRSVGGKKFLAKALEVGRSFYHGEVKGCWEPSGFFSEQEVLILGPGPSVLTHKEAIENFIENRNPYVIALNTLESIDEKYISARAASHPMRLLADCDRYAKYDKPLVTPASMLPDDVKNALPDTRLLDYGISVCDDSFEIHSTFCVLPSPKVVAYALAVAACGKAKRIFLAGFDGYGADDPRRKEVDHIFRLYEKMEQAVEVVSITPTKYEIPSTSVYAL